MIIPPRIQQSDTYDYRGSIFNTPVLTEGKTWLPAAQLIATGVLTSVHRKRTQGRPWFVDLASGFLSMLVLLGSEWCHNLAHAFGASLIRKPPDAIRITWGMPLLHYESINDEQVNPQEHIIRALGGPLFNIGMLPFAWIWKLFTKAGSIARDIADTLLGMNLFLSLVSLLPIPGIDGGPILKWSLVHSGKTPQEADEVVRKTNWGVCAVSAAGSAAAFKKKKNFWGFLIASIAVLSFLIASGLIKEHE